jgi:hypothetical protein
LSQALLFVAAVAFFLALVALPTLLVTGRWSSAWYALKEYAFILFILIVLPMLLGLVWVGIEYLMP